MSTPNTNLTGTDFYGPTPDQRTGVSQQRFLSTTDSILFRMRVCTPGVITSFDPVKQTCTVQPAISDKVRINGVVTEMPIPILGDVPVLAFRAGPFALTFPITSGDECLVLFGDQCMDSWWQSGCPQGGSPPAPQAVKPLHPRRHDLSDGFALVGLWNQKRVVSNWSTSSVQLRTVTGDTVLDLASGRITITANGGVQCKDTSGNVYFEALPGQTQTAGNLRVGTGATGTFTSPTGQVITVQNGIITSLG